jgi:hypothetical protein
VSKFCILREFWDFLKVRKKWWLLPIAVVLAALGILQATSAKSSLAPFIYSLF